MYRFLIEGVAFLRPFGCAWYDRHIDQHLLAEACRIQEQLDLSAEEVEDALKLMRWSPRALLYALTPDPMIVTHRRKEPPNEQFVAADRKQFLRCLYRAFLWDFEMGDLAEYFHRVRGLREVDRAQEIVVKSGEAVAHRGLVRQRMMVGQMEEKAGGGYVMIQGDEAAPEPWELHKKGGQRPPEGSAGTSDSEPSTT